MVVRLSVPELRTRLQPDGRSGDELALLDAREQGVFFDDHLFWAVCVPLSRLELLVADLIPRRSTPVVWCDADGAEGGLAWRAAQRIEQLGWTDVAVLDGGMAAWDGERYSGVNVPSKAFGEWVERRFGTPHMSARELSARQARGEPLVILDSRPMREFRRMSIPGGIDCPGAELVYRVHDLVTDPTTTVVVNCAGRTRSIIGAQSLRNAGLPNPVFALEHGTMGWELAGLTLAHGMVEHAPVPSVAGLEAARAAANEVARRSGVREIDAATAERWIAEAERTTFLLDVRTADEFAAGHLPGSRHAPGGQLVQATDEYVGTLGSRLVLVDEGSAVRATMTASWLTMLGRYEVAVLGGGVSAGDQLEIGPQSPTVVALPSNVPTADAGSLTPTATVIDLADSLQHRDRGHIPGAWWAVRSRLDAAREAVGPQQRVVLTSPDGVLALLAQPEAARLWPDVVVLAGGTAAWTGPLEHGMHRPTTAADDLWYKPYDAENQEVARQHMRDYLTWEVALLEQIGRDDSVRFGEPFHAGR